MPLAAVQQRWWATPRQDQLHSHHVLASQPISSRRCCEGNLQTFQLLTHGCTDQLPYLQVASAVQEEGLPGLMSQLDRGLEEPARRRGAADVITHFCQHAELDFQEHTADLLAVGPPQ